MLGKDSDERHRQTKELKLNFKRGGRKEGENKKWTDGERHTQGERLTETKRQRGQK